MLGKMSDADPRAPDPFPVPPLEEPPAEPPPRPDPDPRPPPEEPPKKIPPEIDPPPDDLSTREWMHRLYEWRNRGSSTSEAVRSATISMIEARRREHRTTHPFTWGPFVAAGDWR
jgi:hypothetical protein